MCNEFHQIRTFAFTKCHRIFVIGIHVALRLFGYSDHSWNIQICILITTHTSTSSSVRTQVLFRNLFPISCSCLPSYSLLFVARGLKGQLGGNYVCPAENIAQSAHILYIGNKELENWLVLQNSLFKVLIDLVLNVHCSILNDAWFVFRLMRTSLSFSFSTSPNFLL